MKRKITLLLLAASSALTMSSQVLIDQHFNNPFVPATAGWVVENLSSPLGTTTWTQGTTNYAAYDGNTTDYFFANYNSTSTLAPAGISNWLITPTVTLYNGAVLQFATKTIDQGTGQLNFSPDRLQIRMAQSTNTTIPSGTTSVGAFTNLLLDINPNLNTNTISAVTNGTMVDGYPKAWTVYSVVVSGLTNSVTGRFAFRYFVNDGGFGGANSNNIGLDAVRYTAPCGPTVQSFTTCANSPVVLNASGGLSTTTYYWTNSANSNTSTASSVSFTTGSSSVVYSLNPTVSGSISCGTTITATVTIGTTGSMSLTSSASSTTICSGTSVTLTASDAASNYTWSTGSNNSVITVTPTSNITYSVGSASGVFPNLCLAGNAISFNVLPNPVISYSYDPASVFCAGGNFTVNASGATSYTYVFSSFSYVGNPLAVTIGSAVTGGGVGQYIYGGTGANGCVSASFAQYTVNPNPSIAVSGQITSGTGTISCRGTVVNLTASGADTYTWSGSGVTGAAANTNPLAYTTSTALGNRTLTVIGTSVEGCTATAHYIFGTSPCVGIEKIEGNTDASIYPNPFANELNLSGINGSVEIYNALGQMVIKTVVRNNEETINTSDLTKGVYIIKAYNTSGELNRTVKLLKN